MAYIMENQLKSAAEEVDKANALKEVAKAIARKKSTTTENAEERARAIERAQVLAEQKVAEMETKLGELELRLARAKSIFSARDKEIAELKVALEESENKWYNMGFPDAENSVESVMFHSWWCGFGGRWMAAMPALGVPEESPFRNPN